MRVLAYVALAGVAQLGYLSLAVPANTVPRYPVQHCEYNAACHSDECATPDVYGGFKCVPSQHPVMVWGADCIKSFHGKKDTTLEAPIVDGKPDMSQAVLLHAVLSITEACGHVEVR